MCVIIFYGVITFKYYFSKNIKLINLNKLIYGMEH